MSTNKIIRHCGINFNNFKGKSGLPVNDFHEATIPTPSKLTVISTAYCELFANGNKLEIKFLLTSEKNRSLEFDDEISRLCSNNETCWIHLSNGFLFSFDFDHESNPLKVDIDCAITQMSCTHSSLYYVTSNSQLIMITGNRRETIHNFPKHQKVKKMVSGVEHCLVMTSNGDVFSFGCGLRGALGHGDINSILSPMQVEGLAGLKIIDIAAGSFHSVAVSSFGDVYTWGWNTHGQLGLPKIAKHTFERTVKSHQQVFTTPQLIELEDEESVTSVSCGCKHTVLRSENNRVFSAGLNNYGQLGLATECEDVEKFTEVPVKIKDSTEVFCGHWSTYFIQ